MTGRSFLHFRIVREVGRGGMGVVYLAEDTTLHRRVAIKRLMDASADSPDTHRLRREAQALALINHPSVVTVHAIEEVDGVPFVVMEWIDGRTLDDLIPSGGLAFPDFAELAIPITEAIAAAHARAVLHRDLKTGNVMVTDEGRIKVVDFGLAKILAGSAGPSLFETDAAPENLVGTLPYMAPERLDGEPADVRTDLYALGVVFYAMLTGSPPFTAGSVPALLRQIVLDPVPDPRQARAGVPDRLARLVLAMLAKDPAARPSSALLVLEELKHSSDELLTGRAASQVPVPPPPAQAPVHPDLEIVRLIRRGRHLWNRRSESALREALACFQEALDRDPEHAPAWIGVADTLNMLSNYGFVHPGDSHVRVKAAVARAVESAGETGEALRALALAVWQFEFDWGEAERLYRRALELQPDSALAHYWLGVLLGVTRRFDEALEALRKAEELDPLSLMAPAARGWFTLFSGRPHQALGVLQRVLALDPRLHPALWFQAEALSALARHEEAVASLNESIEIGGRTCRMLGYLGFMLGQAGRGDEARRLLDELGERRHQEYVPPYFDALVHAGLGERELALGRLESSAESGDTMIRDLGVDPPWWPYREEPRYRALLELMGLVVEGSA